MNELLGSKYNNALVFTADLHRKQKRKGTKIPYLSHLLSVSSLVLEAGGSENEAIAALLHDAIEDCPYDYTGGVTQLRTDIEEKFGQSVLDIVVHCTDTDNNGVKDLSKDKITEWRDRKKAYIASIDKKPPEALIVTCADKLHNARAILSDYRVLGEELWPRFKAGRESLWYYNSLVDAFSRRDDIPKTLVDELEITVRELHALAREDY